MKSVTAAACFVLLLTFGSVTGLTLDNSHNAFLKGSMLSQTATEQRTFLCNQDFYIYYYLAGINYEFFDFNDLEAIDRFGTTGGSSEILIDSSATLMEFGDAYEILMLKGRAYLDGNLKLNCGCMYIVIWYDCDCGEIKMRIFECLDDAQYHYDHLPKHYKAKLILHKEEILAEAYNNDTYYDYLKLLGYFTR